MRIGDAVRVRVVSVSGQQVRLALEAPDDVPIHREEVFQRIAEANREAAQAARTAPDAAPFADPPRLRGEAETES